MKNKKIFDIEEIGFGDEIREPKLTRQPEPEPSYAKPIIKEPEPELILPRKAKEKKVEPEPSRRFKAVEFISPISGSRKKKPTKLHLAHGQYLVDTQELEREHAKVEDFTTLTEDWNLETAHQHFVAEKKPSEKKIFDVEAEIPETKDENFMESVAKEATIVPEEKGYYELPPLSLLSPDLRLRTLLSSAMLDSDPLMLALGETAKGTPVTGKLGNLKHHLAGSSDPRVLHSLVLSLLFKGGPTDLRLILADSQRQNLTTYEGLPHLAMPILKGAAQIKAGLLWLETECARRYEVFQKAQVSGIDAFNKRRPSLLEELPRLPYLVLVLDELSEVAPEWLGPIMRQGPEAGIHLLGATVGESTIPFPSTLIEVDWHYEGTTQRLNLPTVSTTEIEKVLAHIKPQLKLDYLLDPALITEAVLEEEPLIEEILLEEETHVDVVLPKEETLLEEEIFPEPEVLLEAEPLLEETLPEEKVLTEAEALKQAEASIELGELLSAMELFLKHGEASISLLQVQKDLSYSRSVRIMDALQQRGWLKKLANQPKREIAMSYDEYLEISAS